MLTPEPGTDELQLTAVFPAVTVEEARAATGWPLQVGRRSRSDRSRRRPGTRNPARTACAHARGTQPPRARSRLTREHIPRSPPCRTRNPRRLEPPPEDGTSRAECPGHDRTRRRGRFALVSARLSVRDVARPRHRGLGRRRQPVPRFRRRHRRVRDGPRPPEGGHRDQGGGRQVPAHLERLLAREHDPADRAAGRAWRRWASR